MTMTSAPPPSDEATTMTASSRTNATPSFPSETAAHATAMTSDFLALVGFAARLGTCVNNDASGDGEEGRDGQDAKSVRDEAMLLMSLLMGEKAEEILSEDICVKESRCRKRSNRNGGGMLPYCKDRGGGATGDGEFEFTFPSLSLQTEDCMTMTESSPPAGEAAHGESGATEEHRQAGHQEAGEGRAEEDQDLPPPSQLMGRPQSVRDRDSIRDGSEAMAHNVLESFGAALAWRAKTWIKSLANVLALKEQKKAAAGEDAAGEGRSSHRDEVERGAAADGEFSQEADEDEDDIMNSKEMQIIDAIVKSSEEVSVVNIKTSFRVMPNKVSSRKNTIRDQGEQPSASKKAKTKKETKPAPKNTNEYRVTHKLLFEATISMTSNDGVRYNGVKLQAPGYIQGTFTKTSGNNTRSNDEEGVEGDETLTNVSVTLDTDTLALSLERQSRLVVRRAAEAALMAAGGVEASTSPRLTDSPHVHHSIISPRYVLMSPVNMGVYATASWKEQTTPLPQVPSVHALSGQEDITPSTSSSQKSTSAVVSSSSEGGGCESSDSSAATTTTLLPSKKPSGAGSSGISIGIGAPQSPSFPALLSVANDELTRGE